MSALQPAGTVLEKQRPRSGGRGNARE